MDCRCVKSFNSATLAGMVELTQEKADGALNYRAHHPGIHGLAEPGSDQKRRARIGDFAALSLATKASNILLIAALPMMRFIAARRRL